MRSDTILVWLVKPDGCALINGIGFAQVLINGLIVNWESGQIPHDDKQLTGLRPDRDGRNLI
jgi:hypothetical protein